MVYCNKVVAAVKVNGQILREKENTVTLPFGSEYSILIKNLNSVRLQVKVSVDGTDATEGTWLVVGPNSSMELERFIRDGNFERGNRFKFIERTAQIEKHRGIKADDGLIRMEYKVEQVAVQMLRIHYYDYWSCPPNWPYYPPYPRTGRTLDAGITVPGSESQQKFVAASNFETYSQSEVIVLHLRGEVGGKKVAKPVTVKTKPTCATCGKVNKGQNQFCSQCGTALTLI